MNWYNIFYWLTVSDGVKTFFDHASNTFMIFTIISLIILVGVTIWRTVVVSEKKLTNTEEEKVEPEFRAAEKVRVYIRNFFYTCLGLTLFTWLAWAMIPSKKDCIMIITAGTIGNFLQSDTNARKLPADLMKLGHVAIQSWEDQIRTIPQEEREAIGVKTEAEKQKETELADKIKDLAKSYTKEQLNKLLDSIPSK